MKLYNTLGRKLEEFEPLHSGNVKLYTCGPTVYDSQTIGNFRTFVFYDTLKRILGVSGYNVDHVMNVTDVGHLVSDADEGEDKLEKGAKREGKTAAEVAEHYTKAFMQDARELNIQEARIAKATDFIDEQINLVSLLLDKGFAYKSEQAIYFDVSKQGDYGKLTGQKLGEKEVAARKEVMTDKNKRNPQDFALWFFTVGRYADHEMKWPSPWGNGFPGWHAECSAIVHATLGEPLDIHAGGVDLIGTHHTNEMAQTEAAYGHELAKYWLHGEHLLVDSKRMSKSSGNFYTLKDVKEKGYDPMALRLLYLQSHYRSQMNFTWDALEASASSLQKFRGWSDLQLQDKNSENLKANYKEALKNIEFELNKDINTPAAMAILNGMINRVEELGVDSEAIANSIKIIDSYFGLGLSDRQDIDKAQKDIINDREEARKSQDWTKADELRQMLLEQGIEINDSQYGPLWSRI